MYRLYTYVFQLHYLKNIAKVIWCKNEAKTKCGLNTLKKMIVIKSCAN